MRRRPSIKIDPVAIGRAFADACVKTGVSAESTAERAEGGSMILVHSMLLAGYSVEESAKAILTFSEAVFERYATLTMTRLQGGRG